MPGKVRVKIIAGRNLPVMDRGSDTTDAYVEIKFATITYKTDVYRKSLNPQWNSDWYRFEVDDAELQDEPLQIRIMDHDTYSANDAIGKVNISLNPLLLPIFDCLGQKMSSGKGTVMSGWIPVFDTMHGIRGEVNLIVKVDLFSDVNKFRQSSCGVQFFHSPNIPYGYHAQIIHGFVEELVVNDDPEYQWIDKIRTPRASNEARQVVFLKLSGQVQRKIGLKAIDLGANAVIGYIQCFDLEGDVGVVARGIGTAVTLVKIHDATISMGIFSTIQQQHFQQDSPAVIEESMIDNNSVVTTAGGGIAVAIPAVNNNNNNIVGANGIPIGGGGHIRADSVGCKGTHSPIKITTSTSSTVTTSINGGGGGGGGHPISSGGGTSIGSNSNKDTTICRRSSDSDLSVTPKGGSLNISDRPITTFGIGVGAPTSTGVLRITGTTTLKTPLNQDNLDMLEYPFLTMTKYPIGFILHIGATVCARSVKLLERVPNPDEPETRDSWWTELRMEIRSHARALGCNVVLGYTELTTISDEVCVLSVTGTAAVINLQFTSSELALLDTTVAPNQLNGCPTTTATNATTSTGQNGQLQSTIVHVPATLKDVNKNSSVSGTVILPQQQQPPQDTGGGVGVGVAELDTDNNIITPIAHVTAISTNVNALKDNQDSCTMCHIPYTKSSVPFNVHMKRCGVCRHGKVPDVLLATIEIPENIQITGRGCFLQAQVYRNKKDLKSESNAKEISDGLPFLEYDLHRLLINKLKAKGMNAIFGLKSSIAIGEKMMALVATGTAVFLTALPPPNLPKIVAGNLWTNTEKLNDLKKSLQDTVDRNREIYQLKSHNEYEMHGVNGSQHQQQQQHTSSSSTQFQSQSDDTDDSDDDTAEIDLTLGNKDTCVLEVDDIEDLEIISCLMEPCPPDGFHVVNTQNVPGLHDMDIVRNLQMFTQIWRTKFSLNQQCSNFPKHFQRLLQIIYFKLRTMVPCAIVDLKFRLDIPESEEVQILITGMALGLGDPNTKYNNMINTTTNNINNNNTNNTNSTNSFGTMTKLNKRKIGVTSNQPQERLLLNKDLKKAPAALTDDELIFSLEEEHITDLSNSQHQHQQFNNTTASNTSSGNSSSGGGGGGSSKLPNQSSSSPSARNNTANKLQISIKERYGVDITPLSYVPGGKIDKYLGNLNFFFIRESTSIRENGGISGFVHSFITEVLAVARAHVTALGGNAMISFYMTELILVDNPHKNQGQCLISVGGDVVFVSYFTDD